MKKSMTHFDGCKLTRLQDDALDALRRTKMKRIPMPDWMQSVHHSTRDWLLKKGVVRYAMINRDWFAQLVYDPRHVDTSK